MLKQSSTRRGSAIAPGPEAAGDIAVAAFAHLAQDQDTIARFMTQAGLEPQDLRAVSGTQGFLAAVLEFLCNDESQLMAFAANAGLDPQTIDLARKVLAGPEAEWSA